MLQWGLQNKWHPIWEDKAPRNLCPGNQISWQLQTNLLPTPVGYKRMKSKVKYFAILIWYCGLKSLFDQEKHNYKTGEIEH